MKHIARMICRITWHTPQRTADTITTWSEGTRWIYRCTRCGEELLKIDK